MDKNSQPEKMYCVEVDAVTTGIPYGDTFYTHHKYCLTRVNAEESRFMIHSEIRYKKSVWGLVKCRLIHYNVGFFVLCLVTFLFLNYSSFYRKKYLECFG